MKTFITAAYAIAGLVNLAPVAGLAGRPLLEALYGASIPDPTLLLLMQHRAVLFGLVGGVLLMSAFRPPLRPVAATMGGISMAAFLLLFLLADPAPISLENLFWIDLVALQALTAAVVWERKGRLPTASVSGKPS